MRSVEEQPAEAPSVPPATTSTLQDEAFEDVLESPFRSDPAALSTDVVEKSDCCPPLESDLCAPTDDGGGDESEVLPLRDGGCRHPPFRASTKNLPYQFQGTNAECHKQQLDIHVPADLAGSEEATRRPVYFHVHGGGWKRGDRQIPFYGAPSLARFACSDLQCVAVTPSYRLGKFPDFMFDVVAALLWTVRHIAAFGGDPTQIILSGHSAGAHIISLLLLRGTQDFSLPQNVLDECVRGVVLLSGVYTLEAPMYHKPLYPRNALFRSAYIKKTFGTDPTVVDAAAPSVVLFGCGATAPRASRCCVLTGGEQKPASQKKVGWLTSIFSCKSQEPHVKGDTSTDASTADDDDARVRLLPLRSPPFPVAAKNAEDAAKAWRFPTALFGIPFLVLNASCDLGLEVDGAMFAALLTSLKAPDEKEQVDVSRSATSTTMRVVYDVVPSTNHASICWDAKTHSRIQRFLHESSVLLT